ncbi:P-loop containing nucleoside triphosphate hydrolase protein [Dimargaris cristalligena]|uniref:ATP-dependent RNA helicase n=1 Tax=Dimargaris cristalligena TaxID=215637 RepID=A0A4P9ZKK6_9FUNG|nr:P-loop containing nucleoside triphosphate hydrolase protein [Dimargaris cristalligena]|eukprot:RKP33777.1 P-loop containing nucleoside triphosphate hydrolase protein [Dimargaris cristalligena]
MSLGVPLWFSSPTVVSPSQELPLGSPEVPLSAELTECCQREGIAHFFAVQAAVLPLLVQSARSVATRHRLPDLCVSAPTGSGKTLAYLLPIIEKLRSRRIRRLRALIVLPTRDLALQVKAVLDRFTQGTDLVSAVIAGQVPLAQEQELLTGGCPTGAEDDDDDDNDGNDNNGGHSAVDIMVCTPGRLVDHLRSTKNFTLQHLEFLVIDEADRLLNHNFQDWLPKVLESADAATSMSDMPTTPTTVDRWGLPVHDAVTRPSGGLNSHIFNRPTSRMQKLLFSATLSDNPAILAALKLYSPQYICIRDDSLATEDGNLANPRQITVPPTLKEYTLVSDSDTKPLALVYLMYHLQLGTTLCFTRSVEAAHRLFQVLDAFNRIYTAERQKQQQPDGPEFKPFTLAEYSSDLHPSERERLRDQFARGEIQLLVSSDMIARGLDIEQVGAVINYDVPRGIQTYVHRVGRTARAGREGAAYTILESQEIGNFFSMMDRAKHAEKIIKLETERGIKGGYQHAYKLALRRMRTIYK